MDKGKRHGFLGILVACQNIKEDCVFEILRFPT
jgi:hypothetical protein